MIGFLDDDPDWELPPETPLLGKLEDLPTILHRRVVDEVVVALPFTMWRQIDAVAGAALDEGRVIHTSDRLPEDGIHFADSVGADPATVPQAVPTVAWCAHVDTAPPLAGAGAGGHSRHQARGEGRARRHRRLPV